MSDLTFTHIEEAARRQFGISRDEYALCNYIQTWASHPAARIPGYCDRTRGQMADFIGITDRGARKMIAKLLLAGLIEGSAAGFHYRITGKWFSAVALAERERKGEQSSAPGTKFRLTPEQSSALPRNKVPPHTEVNTELHTKGGIPPNPLAASDATLTVEEEKKESPPQVPAAPPPKVKRLSIDRIEVAQVVAYLNQLCGTNYKPDARATQNLVSARMRDGFTVKDFELVIAHKAREWLSDGKMREYLRPETLFGNKFEGYLNAARLSLQNPQQPQNGTSQNGKFAFDPHAALARAAELVAERRERLAARQ